MNYLSILKLIGGLALFLFGMNYMSSSLEKRAGGRMKRILSTLTDVPMKGFILGVAVTALVQSSSATTVMVVGFVNSGLMQLSNSVYIIIGANVGAAVTSWILSLSGIQSTGILLSLLKPASFTPVLALIGILLYLGSKKAKTHDTGSILLGFAVLMFGMETMSDAVKPLASQPGFADALLMFSNPLLGVAIGLGVTAVIQSSSASIGILQALSLTGALTYGSAIPIIMGLNIGTCATAMLSSIGASPKARQAALVHLYFNIIGTAVFLTIYSIVRATYTIPLLAQPINPFGIALVHSVFKLLCAGALMPFGQKLVRLAELSAREKQTGNTALNLLDERLFMTPVVAVAQADQAVHTMAETARDSIENAFRLLANYDEKLSDVIEKQEGELDTFEDKIGTYLVNLSANETTEADGREIAKMLNLIGNFERIGDHAMNIAGSAQELHEKNERFSDMAMHEIGVLEDAIREILRLALLAFEKNDLQSAFRVEPLEQVIDRLSDEVKARHVRRLTNGGCTIETGFVLNDLLGDLERISDHCSNIAACVIEIAQNSMEMHVYTNEIKNGGGELFSSLFREYSSRFCLDQE